MIYRKEDSEKPELRTYDIVVLLLAKNQAELRVIPIGFLELGLEDDHNPVLEEVVVLRRVRVEALVLEVMDPVVQVTTGNYGRRIALTPSR